MTPNLFILVLLGGLAVGGVAVVVSGLLLAKTVRAQGQLIGFLRQRLNYAESRINALERPEVESQCTP